MTQSPNSLHFFFPLKRTKKTNWNCFWSSTLRRSKRGALSGSAIIVSPKKRQRKKTETKEKKRRRKKKKKRFATTTPRGSPGKRRDDEQKRNRRLETRSEMGANIVRAESERRRTTQTTVTFERIDRKRRFEAIRDATRIETIEINESEEEEEKEAKIFASEQRRGASTWSYAPLPKALRPRPMCIDALATKETMRKYDFVEENENIWENRKMSEYKLCVRIRGREYQTSDTKTKLPPDGAKVHIERDRENRFDTTGAMRILDEENNVLGYVPRKVAGEFAGLVDLGVVEVSGTLKYAREDQHAEVKGEDEWQVYVEIEVNILTNTTNVSDIRIDTASILNSRFESATRANAEEFESESWAWLRTKDKIVDALVGLKNAEYLLSTKEKEIRRNFIDLARENDGGRDAALLATRLLARGHAWISDYEKKEYVTNTNDAMRKLVSLSISYDLSSNEGDQNSKDLEYVFGRDFCLNNLKLEEIKHMMCSFSKSPRLLNECLVGWRQKCKTKDKLMIPLRKLCTLDENKENWVVKWKEAKMATHPNWIVLSPTFISLVRTAICVAYRKNLSVSDIYDAISGMRRYPTISTNEHGAGVSESPPWKSREDMLAAYKAVELLNGIEIFNKQKVYGFDVSAEDAPKVIERGRHIETKMLDSWRKGKEVDYDADLLDPNKDMERFSHRAVECRICNHLVTAIEKLGNNKQYSNDCERKAHRKRAVALLRALLAQPFYACSRGKWYDRLFVILGHLKEYQNQFYVCKAALEDSWVVWDDLVNFREKIWSITQKNNGVKVTPHFQMPEKFEMVEDKLHGVPLSQEYIDRKKRLQKYANWKGKGISYDARKLVSVDENGKPIDTMDLTEEQKEPEILLSSVEEYSLAYYEQKLHWKGIHTETSLWNTLLPLLFLDVFFYNEFDGLSFNPWPKSLEFQSLPLDFSEPEWISRRERITRVTLQKIKRGHGAYLLVKNWARWYGIDCYGIHWTAVKNECEHNIAVTEQKKRYLSLTELVEIVRCFESEQLYSISARWIQDPLGTLGQGGMPDLFLWNPKKSKSMCVEVKSTNDRLRPNQIACIHMLKEANFPVKCLKVRDFEHEFDWDTGAKRGKI